VADTVVLSKATDQALLVVRANRTPAADVRRSTDLLERVGVRLAGAVLNALPRKLPTTTSWHRTPAVAPPTEGLDLVTGDGRLYPEAPTVRGQAQVIDSTVGFEETAVIERPRGERPRGRARVGDAEPAPPHLPAQRGGDGDGDDDG
jgi:hypothetical protein